MAVIEHLHLNPRSYNKLVTLGINTIEQIESSFDSLHLNKGVGKVMLRDITYKMENYKMDHGE